MRWARAVASRPGGATTPSPRAGESQSATASTLTRSRDARAPGAARARPPIRWEPAWRACGGAWRVSRVRGQARRSAGVRNRRSSHLPAASNRVIPVRPRSMEGSDTGFEPILDRPTTARVEERRDRPWCSRWFVGSLIAAVVMTGIAVGLALGLRHSSSKKSASRTPAEEACLVFCEGPLLNAVQTLALFNDSKTFVDMPMRADPQAILDVRSWGPPGPRPAFPPIPIPRSTPSSRRGVFPGGCRLSGRRRRTRGRTPLQLALPPPLRTRAGLLGRLRLQPRPGVLERKCAAGVRERALRRRRVGPLAGPAP